MIEFSFFSPFLSSSLLKFHFRLLALFLCAVPSFSILTLSLISRLLISLIFCLLISLISLSLNDLQVTVPGYSVGAEPLDAAQLVETTGQAPSVAVIGGGIAGCGAAWCLQRSGFQVGA